MRKTSMTMNEALQAVSGRAPYRAALNYLSSILLAELTSRYQQMDLSIVPVPNPQDPTRAALDITITPTFSNEVAQAMKPYGICQTELLRIPGLLILRVGEGGAEISFHNALDQMDIGTQPIDRWCESVIDRAIRGTIRARYWDPLSCICDTLDLLPAGQGETFLALCSRLSARAWSVVSDTLGSSLASAYEARDAMAAYMPRLGTDDPWDYIFPPYEDSTSARESACAQFGKVSALWAAKPGARQERMFSFLWDALLSGSRGRRYYTGVPTRFCLYAARFAPADPQAPFCLTELLDTAQTLQLLFPELPEWYQGPAPQPADRGQVAERLRQFDSETDPKFPRRICLVTTWRDGTGTQFRPIPGY